MPNFVPVTKGRHGARRWKRNTDYSFCSQAVVVPLTIPEMPVASRSFPIGFVAAGESFAPAAVLGCVPGQNLLVAVDGRWVGPYVPAAFRAYPFALARAEGRDVLCIDEDSGLLTDGPDGEPFLGADGQPAAAVTEMISFLQKLNEDRHKALHAGSVLKEHGLIEPWPVTLTTSAGEQKVDGLFRISENTLNRLPGDALEKVRNVGGLLIAYCQLLSMYLLPALGQLAAAKADAESRTLPVNAAGELELEFLNEGPSLDFGNLK